MIDMLWESAPGTSRVFCLTQRHTMMRLQEEIDRSERHGTPLTMVLGELAGGPVPNENPAGESPLSRIIVLINQTRRRSDVVGQYGPNGFLLLLVQTRADGAAVFCQRLRQVLQEKAAEVGQGRPLQVTFGLAPHVAGATPVHLLSHAEASLEQSRQAAQR